MCVYKRLNVHENLRWASPVHDIITAEKTYFEAPMEKRFEYAKEYLRTAFLVSLNT